MLLIKHLQPLIELWGIYKLSMILLNDANISSILSVYSFVLIKVEGILALPNTFQNEIMQPCSLCLHLSHDTLLILCKYGIIQKLACYQILMYDAQYHCKIAEREHSIFTII